MSLSAANQDTICEILNVSQEDLTAQIDWLGSTLTATHEAAIVVQIGYWTTAFSKTTKLHPKESNKGVETNPGIRRQQIREAIAIRLRRPDWAEGSGGTRLQRG